MQYYNAFQGCLCIIVICDASIFSTSLLMAYLQERKREMVASAFGEDGAAGRQTRLTEEDLRYLFMV